MSNHEQQPPATEAPPSEIVAPGSYVDTSPVVAPLADAHALETGQVGMIAFLVTEVAFFSTLIVTYLIYIGKSRIGPYPQDVFDMNQVWIATLCLWSSSLTVHFATRALGRGSVGGFRLWWLGTILLGVLFLIGTGIEWHDLIFKWGLTPARNLFGTTYFTLVGFHALHVTIGLLIMLMVFSLTLSALPPTHWPLNPELVSWYWHFVDVVWVVVFIVVYFVGRR
jgi:cytochrome c oxidase subunit 3/cytochrome o ubiquinol oxidase subunit 3